MNILVLCYEYPPIGGGGGVGVQQYAEAWVQKNHRVTVLTSRGRGLAAREIRNGVEIIRVLTVGRKDRATSTFLSMVCYNVTGAIYVLLRCLYFRHFDIINTHFSIPTGPLAVVVAKLLRLPNVLTIIGGDIYDPSKKSSPHRSAFMRRLNSWIINSANRVIAISSDTKKRAEHFYNVRPRIEVINYGFTPRPLQDNCAGSDTLKPGYFYLIAVGRLVKRKGFEYLIQALLYLPDDVVLLLIGDGPLESDLRRLAHEQGVSARVQMKGFRTREEVSHYLRHADCFVLSSLHEGLGIVLQEAMDAGLPIVATDNGGQVDLIRVPRNGILVETRSAAALANAIRCLYDDRELAKSMSNNNRADIAQLHIDKNSQLYINMFQQVISRANLPKSTEVA